MSDFFSLVYLTYLTFDFYSSCSRHSPPDGVVTDVDFVFESSDQLVASFDNGACIVFDMETGKAVVRLETESLDNNAAQVNKVCEKWL